jgi:hypothetical protein
VKKLTRADIKGPRLYAPIREDLRRKILELKKLRRISVGPQVTLVFENRATMIFQVEEMCRAESIEEPAKVQEEIDVYNKVLPDAGQLAATLFIEITDEAQIGPTLNQLVGLQEHVWLKIGNARCKAIFDPDQFKADKLAAVQYLKFPLGAAAAALPVADTAVAVQIDHPNYRHEMRFSEESRAELAKDLV